jgi:hypothetical protein
MKIGTLLIAALALVLAVSSNVAAKDKKKHAQRGMLESMQSVPCGVNERGVSGLGSIFGSVGIQHVNSHEKLCPQYLFRTDEMEYHIRPLDTKHAVLLPVGHEGEFKIKKDRMILRVPDEDKKARDYEVVSMLPVNAGSEEENASYRHVEKRPESRPLENSAGKPESTGKPASEVANRPPQ